MVLHRSRIKQQFLLFIAYVFPSDQEDGKGGLITAIREVTRGHSWCANSPS